MISAGSVVSDSRTAPSTDCSASRFCGGASGAPVKPLPLCVGALMRAAESRRAFGRERMFFALVAALTKKRRPVGRRFARAALRLRGLTLLDDHGLDGRDHAVL